MGDYSVRVLTPSGWETLGRGRYGHVIPGPPSAQADGGGFASASFVIPRQDVFVPAPDTDGGVECEVDYEGFRIFEGRVSEAPVQAVERLVNVQGRGWQYALDEFPVGGLWAHSTMSDWHDAREVVGAKIYDGTSGFGGGGHVEASDTGIVIGYPQNVLWPAGASVGVVCDFGPDPARWPTCLWFKGTKRGSPSQVRLMVRGHERPGGFYPAAEDQWESALPGSTVGMNDTTVYPIGGRYYLGLLLQPKRYVTIALSHFTGASYTPTAEDALLVTELTAFGKWDHAMPSSSGSGPSVPPKVSAVRASTVMFDVFERTPGLATPTVEPEEFVDEVNALGPLWWFRGGPNDYTDGDPVTVPGGSTAPSYDAGAGPLTSGEPTSYAQFVAGNADAVSLALSSIDDLTLFILFRTTDAGQGAGWPSGKGLFDANAPEAGIRDYGLELISTGRVSGGVGDPDVSVAPAVTVNDGLWHTAILRRRRHNRLDFTDHVYEVRVDTVASGEQTHSAASSQPLDSLTLYVARNAGGNHLSVDVAEAVVFGSYLTAEDCDWLHKAALARPRGTLKRTLTRLPELATTQAGTGRTVGDAVDLYHRYRRKVGKGRMPWFYPPPTTPKYALTDQAVKKFNNTSTSVQADSYNRVLVTGTRPDGEAIAIYRHAGTLPGAKLEKSTVHALTNGHGNVDAGGWTNEAGNAMARTTSTPYEGAGSLLVDSTSGTGYSRVRAGISGTLTKGVTYVVTGVYQPRGGSLGASPFDFIEVAEVIAGGPATVYRTLDRLDFRDFPVGQSQGWRAFALAFVAPRNTTAVVRVSAASADIALDAIGVSLSRHHRLDRLGQSRTRTIEFGQNIDVPTAVALADAFLTSKLRTPFAGSVDVVQGDVVTYGPNPMPVHPAALVDDVGELLYVPGVFDPDTLAPGRDGAIVSAGFNGPAESCALSIDNQRDNFEALMARGALFRRRG